MTGNGLVGVPGGAVLAGAAALAGVVTFLAGAAAATSVGAWGREGADSLQVVADSPVAWRVGNALLAAGAGLTGAGLVAFAWRVGGPAAGVGGAAWALAAAAAIAGFLLQGEGTWRAVVLWQEGGAVPAMLASTARSQGLLIGAFMLLGYAGCVAFAYGLHGRGAVGGVAATFAAGAFALGGVFLVSGIPAGAEFPAAWVAVMGLRMASAG